MPRDLFRDHVTRVVCRDYFFNPSPPACGGCANRGECDRMVARTLAFLDELRVGGAGPTTAG